jgi:hypothetical protein
MTVPERLGADPRLLAMRPPPAGPSSMITGDLPDGTRDGHAGHDPDRDPHGEFGGPTGHPRVDAALADLAAAENLPPEQQIATYESVHRALQDTLRTIEQT